MQRLEEQANTRPPIWTLIALATITPMSASIFVPANTEIMNTFGTAYGVAQLVLSSFLFATGVSLLVSGYLSDKFGRRPVLLFGVSLFSAASALGAVAPSIEILIASRVLQGIGAAAAIAVPRAIIRDLYTREESARVLSFLAVAMGIAPIIGPLVGGVLSEVLSWRLIFVCLGITTTVLLATLVATLRETATHIVQAKPAFFPSAIKLLSHPSYIGYTASYMFGVSMYHGFNAGAPYLMSTTLGGTPSDYGLYFVIATSGFAVSALLSSRISERVGSDRLIIIAALPVILGLCMFWIGSGWAHPLALFVPMAFITFGNGFIVPNSVSGAVSVHPEIAGTAAGLNGFLAFGTGALITLIMGFIQDDTIWPLAGMLTLCGALSIAGSVLATRSHVSKA